MELGYPHIGCRALLGGFVDVLRANAALLVNPELQPRQVVAGCRLCDVVVALEMVVASHEIEPLGEVPLGQGVETVAVDAGVVAQQELGPQVERPCGDLAPRTPAVASVVVAGHEFPVGAVGLGFGLAHDEGGGEHELLERKDFERAYHVFILVVFLDVHTRTVEHAQAVVEEVAPLVGNEVAREHDAGVAPHAPHAKAGIGGYASHIEHRFMAVDVAVQCGRHGAFDGERLLELSHSHLEGRAKVVLCIILMHLAAGKVAHQEAAQLLGHMNVGHEHDPANGERIAGFPGCFRQGVGALPVAKERERAFANVDGERCNAVDAQLDVLGGSGGGVCADDGQ